jgi:hypothetical protein
MEADNAASAECTARLLTASAFETPPSLLQHQQQHHAGSSSGASASGSGPQIKTEPGMDDAQQQQQQQPPPKARAGPGRPAKAGGEYSAGYRRLKEYRQRKQENLESLNAEVAAKMAQLDLLKASNAVLQVIAMKMR